MKNLSKQVGERFRQATAIYQQRFRGRKDPLAQVQEDENGTSLDPDAGGIYAAAQYHEQHCPPAVLISS